MEITRDKLKKAGKVAGIGVVGAGIGAGAFSQTVGTDDQKIQNLEDKVDDLEADNSDLQEDLDNRPTQEVVDNLESTIKERNEKIDSLFTQEEVNDMVADATEREGLVDYLPVVADDEVEITSIDVGYFDVTTDNTDNGNIQETVTLDSDEIEGDEFERAEVTYEHEDYDHKYEVNVKTFEDGQDADEYEEELRQAVDQSDYDEDVSQDAYVYRNGDTVVYVHGSADTDEVGYDFDSIASQY